MWSCCCCFLSFCVWTITVLWPLDAYINNPKLYNKQYPFKQKYIYSREKRKTSWLLTTNQKTMMCLRSAHISKTLVVAVNESCFWQFHRHAGAHALAYIHICKRMRNFFGVPTREKTHVPFIMMFSLNFSIHRLMFFVLSGFLFLDTNCASVPVCDCVLHTKCVCGGFTCPALC